MGLGRILCGGVLCGGLLLSGCTPHMEPDERQEFVSPASRLAPTSDILALDLPGLNRDGPIVLDAYRGHVVLLDFWAVWNEPSVREIPVLARLYRDLQEDGFTLIGVSMDRTSLDETRALIADLDLPYPVGLGSADFLSADRGGIRVIPTKLLLDRAGTLRKTYQGVQPEDVLRADILALIAE